MPEFYPRDHYDWRLALEEAESAAPGERHDCLMKYALEARDAADGQTIEPVAPAAPPGYEPPPRCPPAKRKPNP